MRIETPPYQTKRALRETREAMERGAPEVFEGAFLFRETLVRVDVLRPEAQGAGT